jgi:hypothetical protein
MSWAGTRTRRRQQTFPRSSVIVPCYSDYDRPSFSGWLGQKNYSFAPDRLPFWRRPGIVGLWRPTARSSQWWRCMATSGQRWCWASGNKLYWVLLLTYVGPRATSGRQLRTCQRNVAGVCSLLCLHWSDVGPQAIYCVLLLVYVELGQHTLLGIINLISPRLLIHFVFIIRRTWESIIQV